MKQLSVRRWLLAGMASVMLMTGAVGGARAQDEAPADGIATASLDDPGEPDRAIGVFGAAVCGAEGWLLKTNPVLGMNPYVLAAGIGGCLLMLMDMTT
jgi:hypothetical protein